jgi:HPt (histidine-containing phosphotransfer) domain-containing protein
MLRTIRTAVQTGAAEDVYRCAHTLSGSIAIFAARRAADAASRLEQLGRSRDLREGAALVDALTRELTLLEPVLMELGKEGNRENKRFPENC